MQKEIMYGINRVFLAMCCIGACLMIFACGKKQERDCITMSFSGSDFVWTQSFWRPIFDPPLDRKISLDGCLKIRNRLHYALILMAEKREANLNVWQIYVAPMDQNTIDVVVVFNSPIEPADKVVLQELSVMARYLFEEELGVLHDSGSEPNLIKRFPWPAPKSQ